MGQKIHRLETVNEQLAHEIAILKRHKFAGRSEQLSPDQGCLLDDLLDTDMAAIESELKAVNLPPAPAEPPTKLLPLAENQPRRSTAPAHFPSRRTQGDLYGNVGKNPADVVTRQALAAPDSQANRQFPSQAMGGLAPSIPASA